MNHHPLALAALALLVGCSNPSRPTPRRPVARDVPAARAIAPADVPSASASDAGPSEAPPAPGDGGSPTDLRVYRVGDLNCIRDPARERLAASVYGYYSTDRIELEVRNIRHGCAPGPTFAATLEGDVVHVVYDAPTPAALGRCACRHDQFLQIAGLPRGAYRVDVTPRGRGDAGAPVATGVVRRSERAE